MVTIIDTKWTGIAKGIKPDTRRRVVLPKSSVKEDITYHVYVNHSGQIIFDPQVTIPASEAWVFKDKKILASMDQSIVESAKGRIVDRGSFAKYVKDEP
jgi:hypothetical protein